MIEMRNDAFIDGGRDLGVAFYGVGGSEEFDDDTEGGFGAVGSGDQGQVFAVDGGLYREVMSIFSLHCCRHLQGAAQHVRRRKALG